MAQKSFRIAGVVCQPIRLRNSEWKLGYALDEHTVSSVPDGAGGFLTTRTPMGQLVYDLKYGTKRPLARKIALVMAGWVRREYKHFDIDAVVAVPASTSRPWQPVRVIAKRLSEALGIRDFSQELQKARATRSLKNVFDPAERKRELEGVFKATDRLRGKVILVIDDLFRSGTTASEVCKVLRAVGAKKVLLLTATKTRVLT
jgi:competence protein ComFC